MPHPTSSTRCSGFMGRYSHLLSGQFANVASVHPDAASDDASERQGSAVRGGRISRTRSVYAALRSLDSISLTSGQSLR